MNKPARALKIVSLGILFFGACCVLLWPTEEASEAVVYMLDIGQGDSFLIQTKEGIQMLIDGGKDAEVLRELEAVMPRGDRSIDVVLATHPDADHIGGLPYVLDRYTVGLFVTTAAIARTSTFESLLERIDTNHIPAYYLRHGMTFSLGTSTTFSILFPDRDTITWETNTASVVGKLEIEGVKFLFTGDSPESIESFLVHALPHEIDIDILKLGHHGSKTSSSEAFLKATSPTLALISAGKNNSYGHPHKEVLERLKKSGIQWVNTADKGRVKISIEQGTWEIIGK